MKSNANPRAEKSSQMKTEKAFGSRADLSFNTLNFVIRLAFLVAITFFIFFMVRSQIITNVDVTDAESQIFVQRLLYAKDGVSYYDATLGRLYPGVIKLDTFNQDYFERNVQDAFYYGDDNRIIGAKLSLFEADGSKIASRDYVVEYNKDFYDEKEVLYMAGEGFLKGRGGVTGTTMKIPVIILDKEAERGGLLEVVVIMQNA
jgi:hypothetical protein